MPKAFSKAFATLPPARRATRTSRSPVPRRAGSPVRPVTTSLCSTSLFTTLLCATSLFATSSSATSLCATSPPTSPPTASLHPQQQQRAVLTAVERLHLDVRPGLAHRPAQGRGRGTGLGGGSAQDGEQLTAGTEQTVCDDAAHGGGVRADRHDVGTDEPQRIAGTAR